MNTNYVESIVQDIVEGIEKTSNVNYYLTRTHML